MAENEIKYYEEAKAKALNTMEFAMQTYARSNNKLTNIALVDQMKKVIKCIEDLEICNMIGLAPHMK